MSKFVKLTSVSGGSCYVLKDMICRIDSAKLPVDDVPTHENHCPCSVVFLTNGDAITALCRPEYVLSLLEN